MRQNCLLALLLLLLAGCSSGEQPRIRVTPLPTAESTNESAAPPPAGGGQPTSQPPAPSARGWTELEPGLAWREERAGVGTMQIVRIDPALLRVRVAYDAGAPGRVSEWMAAVEPLTVVNGGYFDERGRATALTIYDGVVYGTSYEGFGGMLAVDLNGNVSIRSLRDRPYEQSEELAQALQSSPMLVQGGEAVPLPSDDGERARRTVAALDNDGRLLLIVAGWPTFSLSELGQWLAGSDLGIATALNLDGGSSTGLQLSSGGKTVNVDSLVRVPQVVLVERR